MQADDVRDIVERIHGESPRSAVQVAGGWSGTGIWRVELESGPHLARIFSKRDAIVVEREAAALEHAARHGLPVSAVAARGESGGYAVLLVRWIEGCDLRESLVAQPQLVTSYGTQFGRLQARLHELDAPPDLPDALDWPTPGAYPERLRSLLRDLGTGPGRFLHLDYHPLNVLVDDGAIRGLIDWTNAGHGDPRLDVARTWLILRLVPRLDPATERQVMPAVRAFSRCWHRAYRAERGAVEDIAPFLAWAGYGLHYDLGRKPADVVGDEAMQVLDGTLQELERDIARWMSMSGLE